MEQNPTVAILTLALLTAPALAGGVTASADELPAVDDANLHGNDSVTVTPIPSLSEGAWTQEAKLVSEEPRAEEWAGSDVDLDGSTAVVGAPTMWSTSQPGRVFVFENGPDGWSLQETFQGEESADRFGHSVSVDGNRIAVGAPHGDTPDASFAGGVHVYERADNGDWERAAIFAGEDSTLGDEFGVEVALEGDTLVAGARRDEPNGLDDEGSAYVFEFGSGGWTQEAKLVPDAPKEDLKFGATLDVEKDAILFGVHNNARQAFDGGAAFVFENVPGQGWTQTGKVWPSDPGSFHRFGYSVSLNGGQAAIGAPGHAGSGAVYLFERAVDGEWIEKTRIKGDGNPEDSFGRSVDLGEGRLVIGDDTADEFDQPPVPAVAEFAGSGAAFVFEEHEDRWRQSVKVMANDRGNVGPLSVDDGTDVGSWDRDRFGWSLALDGDRFLVGGPQADTDEHDQAGSAYVFTAGCSGQPTPAPASPPAPGCLPGGGAS